MPLSLPTELLVWSVFWVALAATAIMDIRHGIIPDWANTALAASGLVHSVRETGLIYPALVAAIIAFCIVFTSHELYRRWRHRPGLGMGDIKFLAAAAIWTGLAGLPSLVLIASSSALLFLLIRRLAGFDLTPETRLAFDPHLAASLVLL